jgi:APA family basic amino acid/polyamine antiporter
VIGKTASCAAMALTFAAYAVNGSARRERVVAAAVVVVVTAVNLRGITRTAGLARILVAGSLAALAVAVAVIFASGQADAAPLVDGGIDGGVYGTLQAAGLLFFAFAGYARIATLGEEVRDPRRTIPRAILIALAITVAVYAVIGIAVLAALGADTLAGTTTPLATAVEAVGAAWAEPVVRFGAAIASAGALLALVAGVGRTALAMAREGDLPRVLAAVDERRSVPHHAELAVGAAAVVLVLLTNIRGAIGFSSFGVLTYYAIANAAAFTQRGAERRTPRTLNAIGLVACLGLVVTLPAGAVAAGVGVLALGLGGRLVAVRRRRPSVEH